MSQNKQGIPAPFIDRYIENPSIVCRCGKVHSGDYGIYDYGHHMCFHDHQLIWILGPDMTENKHHWTLMCPGCGKTFSIDNSQND